jgi:UDP-3-O-[3-hydroxymyristoyl] glucosamine N-acyltransferase
MLFSAAQISILLNGRIEGNADTTVSSFGKIEDAQEGQLTFLANPRYEDYLYSTNASIAIINENYVLLEKVKPTLIRVADAYSAFALLMNKYQEMAQGPVSGIQQPSYISATASIGQDVFIGAFAYIGENVVIGNKTRIFPNSFIGDNVRIGDNCNIQPGVKIMHDCLIGSHVNIHSGSVIGSDGFGFAPQPDGSFHKIPQIGNVIIEDHVEIGSNATIDRATMGSTIIKSGAKLDNLIQIAHNVEVGNSTVIAAQAGISGSTKIGRNVKIGGQAGLVGHIQVADGTRINAQSGVSKSIKNSFSYVTGSPAQDSASALRSQALFKNLPELEKRLKFLEDLVKQLMAERATFSGNGVK